MAISPILLYIGMLTGAQAFQTTPIKHAPAIVLALTPHLAAWAKVQVDGALAAAGANAATVGLDKLGNVGVLYHGLELMGGGAILSPAWSSAPSASLSSRRISSRRRPSPSPSRC